MLNALCFSFAALLHSASSTLPSHVDHLVKKRILQQLSLSDAPLEYRFDDDSCAEKGEYFYSGDSIVLSSTSTHWPSRFEISLTDILDGKKINFSLEQKNRTVTQEARHNFSTDPSLALASESSRKWWLLSLGVAGIVVGGFIISRSGSPSTVTARPLRLRTF